MRKNMNVTLEQLLKQWEMATGVEVTEELLETPDFVKSIVTQEWKNIKDGKYSK